MIIVDASFAAAWLLPDEASAVAEKILKAILSDREELAVPELWSYEMMNLLLTAFKRKRIEEAQVAVALRLIQSIPCVFYDHRTLLARNRTVTLAEKFALSAYDASYLELADRLQCRLYTLDDSLNKAADKLGLS